MYSVPKLKSFTAAALDKAVEKLLAALKEEASAVKTEADWKTFRDRWMARKNGVLTEINDLWLKAAPKEAKREVGQRVNQLKALVEEAVAKAEHLQAQGASGPSAKVRLRRPRHHAPRQPPPARFRTSRDQDDARNRLRLPQPRLLG